MLSTEELQYKDRCFQFGLKACEDTSLGYFFTWWYRKHPSLSHMSPRDAVDAGALDKVATLWKKHKAKYNNDRQKQN